MEKSGNITKEIARQILELTEPAGRRWPQPLEADGTLDVENVYYAPYQYDDYLLLYELFNRLKFFYMKGSCCLFSYRDKIDFTGFNWPHVGYFSEDGEKIPPKVNFLVSDGNGKLIKTMKSMVALRQFYYSHVPTMAVFEARGLAEIRSTLEVITRYHSGFLLEDISYHQLMELGERNERLKQEKMQAQMDLLMRELSQARDTWI